MKTDLERFVELYKSFGIDVIVNEETNLTYGETSKIVLHQGSHCDKEEDTTSDKFDGWMGMYTTVLFDKEGKFIKQGFWE